jgi:hypothetical protein
MQKRMLIVDGQPALGFLAEIANDAGGGGYKGSTRTKPFGRAGPARIVPEST